jgi:endoglucanase
MRDGPVPLQYLLVDTGLRPRDVDRFVKIGDTISYAQQPLELQGDTLAGHSLDNRVSVAALTFCLEELQKRMHLWDVWAVANTQEETTGGGARTSAFQLNPELAVVIDTTWGRSPGVPDHMTFPIGKGPTLGWGPDVHSGLHKAFIEVADKMELPYAIEIMPSHSGTDAHVIQVTSEGIPCMTVLIPIRYMHTPVEVVSMVDIKRAGSLIAEFIAQLSTDFMQHLSLD